MAKSHKTKVFTVDSRSSGQVDSSLGDQIRAMSEVIRTKMLRSIVHAGAEVLYEELKTRAPTGKTGNLKAAIYQFHEGQKSGANQQAYLVGVNKRKAPHWHMVEYGHRYPYKVVFSKGKWKTLKTIPGKDPDAIRGAHPYLRPAWDAQKNAVIDAMRNRAVLRFHEYAAGSWPTTS